MNDEEDFPAVLRLTRRTLGCSQSALAQALGVATPTLARWESGVAAPGLERRHAIVRRIHALVRQHRMKVKALARRTGAAKRRGDRAR
jgi:transcriptional regulator with XRE-family HTH domain